MHISFDKYQGTGNDFILIDKSAQKLPKIDAEFIRDLCHRRFGIGADGIIFVDKSPEFDFDMFYYNADGSASFCGNGSRCAIIFAKKQGYFSRNTVNFHSNDGAHKATINGNLVKLQMHDVKGIEKYGNDLILNTGSPHYVKQVKEANKTNVFETGRAIRMSKDFKAVGINVNFLELKKNGIKVRTYERGVEDETLSCGTGVTACALAANILNPDYQSPVAIETKGGNLKVYFNKKDDSFQDVWLEGPADFVFSGQINY